MTVEHLIGASQGGHLKQLKQAIAERFPELTVLERASFFEELDAANTVTACSFCNSTTSRDRQSKDMRRLLFDAQGSAEEGLVIVTSELETILNRKRADVLWKMTSVREAFERSILPGLTHGSETESS